MYLMLLGFVIWSFPNGSLYWKWRRTLLDCWVSRAMDCSCWNHVDFDIPLRPDRVSPTRMNGSKFRWRHQCSIKGELGHKWKHKRWNAALDIITHNWIPTMKEDSCPTQFQKMWNAEKTSLTNTFVLVVEVALGNTHMDLRDQQPTSATIETDRSSSAVY